MRHILSLSVVAIIFVQYVYGQSTYRYEVEKVAEGIYVLKPVINNFRWVTSNIEVIINDEDVFVVDSGLLPSAGIEAIREIKKLTTKPVKYLVNTHWHGDHWQGNEAFDANYPGVEIISSKEGFNGITRNGMVWVRQFYAKNWTRIIQDYETAIKNGAFDGKAELPLDSVKLLKEGLREMKRDFDELKQLEPKLPTLVFNDKLILKRGQREIQILYLGYGNTTGDVIVYLPAEKILIGGDLVVYPSPYESGSFSREWLETSKKLNNFEYVHLIPGHGEVQHDAQYVNYLIALFEEIILQMNETFISGKNLIDDFKSTVTHQSVISALAKKRPEFIQYLRNLDPNFVPAAVRSSFQKTKEGKL